MVNTTTPTYSPINGGNPASVTHAVEALTNQLGAFADDVAARCLFGDNYRRAVASNVDRAFFALSKGETETAAMFAGYAVAGVA